MESSRLRVILFIRLFGKEGLLYNTWAKQGVKTNNFKTFYQKKKKK